MINSRIATGDITCYMGLSYLSLVIDFVFNIIQPYSSALGTGSPGCFTPKSPAPVTAETPTDRKFLATDVPPFNWDPRSGYSSARESVSLACSTASVGTSLYDLWVRGNCMSSNQCHLFIWLPAHARSSKFENPQNSKLNKTVCLSSRRLCWILATPPRSLPPLCCIQPLPCWLSTCRTPPWPSSWTWKAMPRKRSSTLGSDLLNLRKLEDVSIGRRFLGGSTEAYHPLPLTP